MCGWLIFLLNCSLPVLYQVQYQCQMVKKTNKRKKKINATYLNMLDCV